MALTQFDKDMDIIAKLSDSPNVDDGLTASQLKAKFDEGGKAVKEFINGTLLREVAEKPTFTGIIKAEGGNFIVAEAGKDYQEPLGAGSVSAEMLADNVTPATIGAAALDSNGKVTATQTSSYIQSITASTTLALTHAGRFLQANSTSAITITIPANASVAFPNQTEIEVCQWNTGAVTIAAASGVTLVSLDNSKKIAGRYGCVCLKKIATNTWLLAGALA